MLVYLLWVLYECVYWFMLIVLVVELCLMVIDVMLFVLFMELLFLELGGCVEDVVCLIDMLIVWLGVENVCYL